MAANALKRFWAGGFDCVTDASKVAAAIAAAEFKAWNSRSARAANPKHCRGQFCRQPGLGHAGAGATRENSGGQPATDRSTAVRSGTAECGKDRGSGSETTNTVVNASFC